MVGFLVYRIYIVLQPQEEDSFVVRPPSPTITDKVVLPTELPDMPKQGSGSSVAPLWRNSPLHFSEGRGGAGGGGAIASSIKVLMFAEKPDGSFRVRLQTDTKKWYSVGEEFETYKILEIDGEAETVRIYDSRSGGTPVTIKKE